MDTATHALGTNPVAPCRFTAAVLAGGRSTRMGVDKSFLKVGSEMLVERQLRCLREAGAEDVLISGRRGVDYSGLNAQVVFDQRPDCGPLAGLAAVLQAASCAMILILAVDMPAMNPAMLRKILGRCSSDRGCVPAEENRFQPLAAAYPKTAHVLAEACLDRKQLSVQRFAQRALADGLVQSLTIEASEEICFANWNRPSDWG